MDGSGIEVIGGTGSGAAAGASVGGPWGALIGGAIGLAGSLLGGSSAKKAAEQQRQWMEYMSSTAHQREVKDLRAAGLNPILSATGGAGAPVGSSAAAQVFDPGQAANAGAEVGQRIASARSLIQAQLDNVQQDTLTKNAQAGQAKALGLKAVADTGVADKTRENLDIQTKILKQDFERGAGSAAQSKNIEEIYGGKAGIILQWINEISKALSGVGGAAKSLDGGKR